MMRLMKFIIVSITINISVIAANQSWRPQSYLDLKKHQLLPRWNQRWHHRGDGDRITNIAASDTVPAESAEGPSVPQSTDRETIIGTLDSSAASTNTIPDHVDEDLASFSSSSPSTRSDFFHRHPFYNRHLLTRNEEKAILGRAVLTTPHRRMPAIRIAPGPRPPFLTPQYPVPIFSSTPIYVTKSTICKSLECALRDLRIIDQYSYNSSGGTTATSKYAGPAFLARRNCVIVNVGHVRAIVTRDQIIIFLPWDQEMMNNSSGSSNNNNIQNESHDNDILQTIHSLVEALVTHLNSIYHPHHNYFFFDHEGRSTSTSSDSSSTSNRADIAEYIGEHRLQIKHKQNSKEKKKKQRIETSKQKQKQHNNANNNIIPAAGPNSKTPPFELVVIEALLGHVCSHESNKASDLIQRVNDVLSGIIHTGDTSNKKKDAFLETQRKLGELLPLKNKVDELEAECSEVAGAIAEVLKNDEDMAAMRLSEIAVLRDNNHQGSPTNEILLEDGDPYNLHVEVELLFEDYLLQMDEVLHSLRKIQSSITNTEEVVEIELDLLRNRIMHYEMLLELSGLVVGIVAAVTGAFGMNLVSGFEDHPQMFYQVSVGLIILMVIMGYTILRKLSLDNIL